MSLINRLELVKDMIQNTIDKGTKTVEDIHIAIGDTAFEILEKQGGLDEEAKALKEQHNELLRTIYGKIREVNGKVGEFASDVFESLEDSEVILKNMAEGEKNKQDK